MKTKKSPEVIDEVVEIKTSDLVTFGKENGVYISAFMFLWGIACYLLLGVIDKGDVILFFAEDRTDFKNAFFVFCTHIGEGYVYVLATAAFMFFAYSKSLAISLNALAVLAVSQILKKFFQHERPVRYFTDLLERPDLPNYIPDVILHDGWTTSFPSGHTTSAFAFYTLLAFFIPNKFLKLLCLGLALLVGLSRMYLVQHFLKDVTSGMITGFVIACFMYWVHEQYLSKKFSGKLRVK